jgi:hypothetical protein
VGAAKNFFSIEVLPGKENGRSMLLRTFITILPYCISINASDAASAPEVLSVDSDEAYIGMLPASQLTYSPLMSAIPFYAVPT